MKLNETHCPFTGPDGKVYTNRGAFIDERVAIVYMTNKDNGLKATDWQGNVLAETVHVTSEWTENRGQESYRMRAVRFTIDGMTYSGRYGYDWGQLVRAKRVKG